VLAARASSEKTLSDRQRGSAEKLPLAPKKPGNTEFPLKKKPTALAPQKGAEVLATHASSPWQAPFERAASQALEDSTSEMSQENPLFSASESSDADQADPQAAAVIALQEVSQRQQAEEQLRIKAEYDAKIRAAVEAENRKAEEEATIAKARQEAVESHQRERLARVETEKKHAEQAAAAKTRQEALDKQRAADLERGRQAPDAAGSHAQNAAVKALEQPGHTSLASPSREPEQTGPKRKASIVGADPKNISLAFYGEGWRQKIERIGAVNYPRLYKDRDYAPLVVTVTLNSDGTLAGVRIDKSSGQQEMDDAVSRIVEMSAPFAAFPPDLKRSYDQIDITRTWVFEHRPRIKNY
jgi:protein TonB